MAKTKIINQSGKRKKAIARATLKPGTGKIYVNNKELELHTPKMARERIREPLVLAKDAVKKFDIQVSAKGGGFASQADAIRLAIAKGLAEHDSSLKDVFLDYDRQLIVADVRVRETRKPNSHGKARAKRQKSYR